MKIAITLLFISFITSGYLVPANAQIQDDRYFNSTHKYINKKIVKKVVQKQQPKRYVKKKSIKNYSNNALATNYNYTNAYRDDFIVSSGQETKFIQDTIAAPIKAAGAAIIGGRPSGCPNRFCGCALSLHLFGKIIPHLNLANNWRVYFPRTQAAPGMVAARSGHVFKLLAHIGGNTWRVWDANSGRGKIRIHNRSIAGYTIVNPHNRSG